MPDVDVVRAVDAPPRVVADGDVVRACVHADRGLDSDRRVNDSRSIDVRAAHPRAVFPEPVLHRCTAPHRRRVVATFLHPILEVLRRCRLSNPTCCRGARFIAPSFRSGVCSTIRTRDGVAENVQHQVGAGNDVHKRELVVIECQNRGVAYRPIAFVVEDRVESGRDRSRAELGNEVTGTFWIDYGQIKLDARRFRRDLS